MSEGSLAKDPVLVDDWHVVARSSDLPEGGIVKARLLGVNLVVWRIRGEPHTWLDLCVHRGSRLSLGHVEDGRLVCAYHGWTYDSEGQCVRFPAHPDQKPPRTAHTRTFSAQEAYGYVWASLESPKSDVPPFPEWDDPSYRKIICAPLDYHASAPRAVENFLDVGHFLFVHAGLLGDREHTRIEDYEVNSTREGILATDVKVWQPDPDGTGVGKYVNYTYGVRRPFTAYFTKSSNGEKYMIQLSVTPVDELESIAWMTIGMNYGHDLPKDSLWREARQLVSLKGGILVLDDTTLDKPYAEKMELVTHHWSGKHHQVVMGINLVTTLWTDGDRLIPCDFRVYDKPMGEKGPFGGKDKNEHFRDMLTVAKERGFNPRFVSFDSWYTALENLKLIRNLGWHWLAGMKGNRLVNPDGRKGGNVPLESIEILANGRKVHLRGYEFVKVFKSVSKNGDVEYHATDDLEMKEKECEDLADEAWGIEVYHRGIKQRCGVERSQVRVAAKQLAHITLSLRAFLRLELERLRRGVSWYESKTSVIRGAISSYLASPVLRLASA